jgi:fucose permease
MKNVAEVETASPSRSGVRSQVALVYGAALLQGLTVVSYPASGTVLRSQFGLSNADYGSLFIPQTIFTIVGSLLGGALAKRLGLQRLLVLALAASAGSALCLGSIVLMPPGQVLPVLLTGTACMGLGFGLAAAPINTYPGLLFPDRGATALVALHTVLGAGFTIGPVLVGALVSTGQWVVFPVALLAVSLTLLLWALRERLPVQQEAKFEGSERRSVGPAWLVLLSLIAVLYAFAEGTFSNWASIFLNEARGVSESTAALAISGFWAGLTVGRLAVAGLVSFVKPQVVWLVLPVLMVAVFLSLPMVSGPATGVAAFVLAGLSASAFFPLTVAIASDCYPDKTAVVASLLTAALMVGVGAGSFLLGALRESLPFDTLYRVSALYPAAAGTLGLITILALRSRLRPEEESHA